MGFQVSPGVEIKEFDLTAIVPAVTTTPTAFVGAFTWGPQDQRVLINSEKTLRETFGTPSTETFYSTSWFIAQNFLTYGSNLLLGRVSLDDDQNAYTNGSVPLGTDDIIKIKNREDFEEKYPGSTITDFSFAAKFPGELGNNIEVIVYDIDQSDFELSPLTSVVAGSKKLSVSEARRIRGYVNNTAPDTSSYASVTNTNAKDEIHIVVVDKTGKISGNKLSVLESFIGVSKSPTAKNLDGTTNYWRNVINNKSQYIWAGGAPEEVPDFDYSSTFFEETSFTTGQFSKGLMGASLFQAAADNDGDGDIDGNDLAFVLAGWGPNATPSTSYQVGGFTESPGGFTMYIKGVDGTGTSFTTVFANASIGDEIIITTQSGINIRTEISSKFQTSSLTPDWYLVTIKLSNEQYNQLLGISLNTPLNISFETNTLITGETVLSIQEQSGSIRYYGSKTGERINYSNKNDTNSSTNIVETYTVSNIIDWDAEVDSIFSYFRAGIIIHKLGDGRNTKILTALDRSDAESNVVAAVEELFGDAETVDISLIIAGDLQADGGSWSKEIIRIAESRKDCVAFVSPPTQDIIDAAPRDRMDIILNYRNGQGPQGGYLGLGSSSYGVLDSGPKYQYDRYNDRFIHVPMCGDIAGTCVRTDTTREPWYSPAGYDRGRINNIVKLIYSPNKEERDILYQKGINPVVTFQGSGAILFGDKTLQLKPSAFDRINVRRLFIVLEKAIATAAKFQLFEFNDAFTRNQFRQLVEPFLRDVQGRRGITSYAVVCDESNNPPSIIDSNQFVADIFVAPARSINFIKLNFVATPTGIQFAEFGG